MALAAVTSGRAPSAPMGRGPAHGFVRQDVAQKSQPFGEGSEQIANDTAIEIFVIYVTANSACSV
jgi:hypothetical protein